MKNIKNYLENKLSAIVEDIRFFDVRREYGEVARLEELANNTKSQIETLESIIIVGEGNLVRFNADGTFRLWSVRIPEGGEQIVEHYDADISFEAYDDLLEAADCIDVTETFDLALISPIVVVTDNLQDRAIDVYYFVDNDAIDNMRF